MSVTSIGEELASIFGSSLVTPNGSTVQTKVALSNKSVIGLYFSAHWCPPCRGFTPVLSEKYRTSYRAKGMEIIFVSSDRDEHSFKEYHGSMPWLALPFADRQLKDSLSMKYGVSGIPMLIIIDGQKPGARVITVNGREEVMNDSSGSKFFGVTSGFAGQGQSLGGSSGGASAVVDASSSVHVDRSKPITSIQVRFPDGKRVNQEFNSSAKCGEVLSFVSKSLGSAGGKRIKLVAGFPPVEIPDLDITVMAAGIANAQVTVQLV